MNTRPHPDPPIRAVCSGSTLFASMLNSSVMLGNYLQQTNSADDIFRCIFFLDALRVNKTFQQQECNLNKQFNDFYKICMFFVVLLCVCVFYFFIFVVVVVLSLKPTVIEKLFQEPSADQGIKQFGSKANVCVCVCVCVCVLLVFFLILIGPENIYCHASQEWQWRHVLFTK